MSAKTYANSLSILFFAACVYDAIAKASQIFPEAHRFEV